LIGLTGYGREETFERMRASGFDEHLLKPCEPEHLEQIIATATRP
jgi:CheY-like chemotaxis protein